MNPGKLLVRRMISLVITISISILLWSCYYDSKEFLFPEISNTCDTTNITFTSSITPILNQYCLGCHSNTSSAFGNNIKLEDYADVKIQADNGKLLGSISHNSGYSPMPKGAAKLDNCEINTVNKWVGAGTPTD